MQTEGFKSFFYRKYKNKNLTREINKKTLK